MIVRPNANDATHPDPGVAQNGYHMQHNVKFTEAGCGDGSNVVRSGGDAGFGYPMDAGNKHDSIPVYPGVPPYMLDKKE